MDADELVVTVLALSDRIKKLEALVRAMNDLTEVERDNPPSVLASDSVRGDIGRDEIVEAKRAVIAARAALNSCGSF